MYVVNVINVFTACALDALSAERAIVTLMLSVRPSVRRPILSVTLR